MLLGTPHRGCNGVRTGYCANEWAPNLSRAEAKGAKLANPGSVVPREGAGAIKLRLDISRVARIARFANRLSDDEHAALVAGLSGLRPHKGSLPGQGGCKTQLCAIRELVRIARSGQDEDLGLYLSVSVNNTDIAVAPERASRRCRQLFSDAYLLPGALERLQPVRKDEAQQAGSGTPLGVVAAPEKRAGELLHSAIRKVYSACLEQMIEDARWYQRPFVYGFEREAAPMATAAPPQP